MNENKKIIVDLVNKIKYEVTEEQMAILAGSAKPLSEVEFIDWYAKIDDLQLVDRKHPWFNGEKARQLRGLMRRMVTLTCEIGGKAIPIGRRLLNWVFAFIERHPRTFNAAVIMAALAFVIAQLPIIRLLLLPIVKVVAVGIIGYVFISEHAGGLNGNHMVIR